MTTKTFIKTIGSKGLLSDYNTEGKKLQTELIAGDNITIDGNTISSDQKLTFDTTPTAGSSNPVTSDGINTALDSRIPAPTSTTGTQVLKCINGVVQWVSE